jgi:DNA-binding NarL/FixJ family response regulator
MRVLLADPDPATREAIGVLLHRLPQVEVISEGTDGRFALALARTMRSDVLIFVLAFPGFTGPVSHSASPCTRRRTWRRPRGTRERWRMSPRWTHRTNWWP